MQLEHDGPEYRLYLPEGDPPFLDFPPPPSPILERAVESSGGRLYLVTGAGLLREETGRLSMTLPPVAPGRGSTTTYTFPPGWRIVESESWDGISTVEAFVLESGSRAPG